jgi:hypothetical protein
VLRRDDKKHVKHARTDADVAKEYQDFLIVDHRDEINAPHSPKSLALKIVEDMPSTRSRLRRARKFAMDPVRSREALLSTFRM